MNNIQANTKNMGEKSKTNQTAIRKYRRPCCRSRYWAEADLERVALHVSGDGIEHLACAIGKKGKGRGDPRPRAPDTFEDAHSTHILAGLAGLAAGSPDSRTTQTLGQPGNCSRILAVFGCGWHASAGTPLTIGCAGPARTPSGKASFSNPAGALAPLHLQRLGCKKLTKEIPIRGSFLGSAITIPLLAACTSPPRVVVDLHLSGIVTCSETEMEPTSCWIHQPNIKNRNMHDRQLVLRV